MSAVRRLARRGRCLGTCGSTTGPPPTVCPAEHPHMHLTCSEGYVVTAGRGAVQTLTASGYRVTPARAGHRRLVHAGHDPPAGQRGRPAHHRPDAEQRPARGGRRGAHPAAGAPRRPRDVRRRDRIPADVPEAGAGAGRPRPARPRDWRVPGAARGAGAPRSRWPHSTGPPPRWSGPGSTQWRERWTRGRAGRRGGDGEQLDAAARQGTSPSRRSRVVRPGATARGRFGMCGRLDVYA